MTLDERIDRINHMQELYDRIHNILTMEENAREILLENEELVIELEEYYESPDWIADHDDEQADRFPKDMNRWILTEDAIYDLLMEVDELVIDGFESAEEVEDLKYLESLDGVESSDESEE